MYSLVIFAEKYRLFTVTKDVFLYFQHVFSCICNEKYRILTENMSNCDIVGPLFFQINHRVLHDTSLTLV